MGQGMIIDGIAASQAVDSSGEVLDIKGCDISELEEGRGVLNHEHRGADSPGASPNDIVGEIIFARKIFGADDCQNERQLGYWKQVKLPFIYIQAELFDGDGDHQGAKSLAATIRHYKTRDKSILTRYSIEGSTLQKEGNVLKRCVARRVAATIVPCNRSCHSDVLSDPNAPKGPVDYAEKEDLLDFDAKKSESEYQHPMFTKLGGSIGYEGDPEVPFEKALTAGMPAAAPGTLTGGAALQREDSSMRKFRGTALAAIRDYPGVTFTRGEFKTFAKTKMPEASDQFLDHFTDLAEDYHVRRKLTKKEAPKGSGTGITAGHIAEIAAADKAPAAKSPKAPKTPPVEKATIRGVQIESNPTVKRPVFDEEKGVLHAPFGSFPLYKPDAEHFNRILSNPKVEEVHNQAMAGWVKVHKLLKEGRVPPEVVAHAALFAQLSPNCLDADTEALTHRGWIRGFDLKSDDVLLTKNALTGALEWQGMTDLRLFPDYEGPATVLKSRSFHAVTTPDHRWLITTGRGHVREKTSRMLTPNQDRIHRTGTYLSPATGGLTPDEAEVLGWFVTDGHFTRSKNCDGSRGGKYDVAGVYALLNQSTVGNSVKCARIEALLARVSDEVTATTHKDGKRVWRLGPALTKKMLWHAPNRYLEVQALLDLGQESLERLYEAMVLGDGSCWGGSNITVWKKKETIVTGRREQADAIQVLLTMLGYASSVTWRDMSMYEPKSEKMSNTPVMTGCFVVTKLNRPTVLLEERHISTVENYKGGMWCPVVPNTFFVARRSGSVYITGNTPVPMQELMYSKLVDSMHATGADPTKPGFSDKTKADWVGRDKATEYPEHSREFFVNHPGIHLQNDSKLTGRTKGDIGGFMLANDKMKNMDRYHAVHQPLVDLINKNGRDVRTTASEMMGHKHLGGLWEQKRQTALSAGKPDIGPYNGPAISGLAPKTSRYMLGMVGGGNVFVPDTHMVRHLTGLEQRADPKTIPLLKNLMWNEMNSPVLEGIDRWYAKNHPAVQHMLNHPTWGKHFDRPEDAIFPAFWKHWIGIAPDERSRGMYNQNNTEGTTHAPFWNAIDPFVNDDVQKNETGSLPERTARIHAQYVRDYGEVPASMLYHAHLLPHLLDAAEQREKGEGGLTFMAKAMGADQLDIALRKAVADFETHPTLLEPEMPAVHKVHIKIGENHHPAGRFMIVGGNLHHLEDYHGLIGKMLPQGPVNETTISRIHGLKMSPHLRIENDDYQSPPEPHTDAPPVLPMAPAPVQRPSVFHYTRVGHDQPHVLEVQSGQYTLDGKRLSYPEVQTIVGNIKNKAAVIRYRDSEIGNRISKMETAFETVLSKARRPMVDRRPPAAAEPSQPPAYNGSSDPGDALQHVRAAVAAGHLHPDVERALTAHIYTDPMTGLGNKYAADRFKEQQKPGVYVGLDGTDFSAVNNAFGHATGDEAIKTYGHAVRSALDEAAPGVGKAFRAGGDEMMVHLPSHEHAARFARALHQHLDAVPPIQGVHKLSAGMGIGLTPEHADKALYAAKEQKYLPGQEHIPARDRKRAFPVGQAPNMIHSLVPGHEGAIPLSEPHAAGVQHTLATAGHTPPAAPAATAQRPAA